MTPDVVKLLQKKDSQNEEHDAILAHVRGLIKESRTKMSAKYPDWDLQDEVYRGVRYPDKEDKKRQEKGEPEKMVVPNTFAQVMTFTSFLFLMFNQNQHFFEMEGTGDEDAGQKQRDVEKVLSRDLRRNSFNTILFQHLLDTARFGPSPLECSWTRKTTRAYVTPEPSMVTINNVTVPVREGSSWQEFVKYEGNMVRAVSPYRWFPDTRFPLVDFQRGEFCGSEEEFTIGALKELEKAGEVAGVDHIDPMAANAKELRGGATRSTSALDETWRKNFSSSNSSSTVVVTKVQVRIIPAKFKIDGDKVLGPEEYPILYHVWYANDNRIIRVEPAFWWHNEFGYTLAQFTPDMHHTVTLGLADLIYRLQDVITWYVNAHVTSVRRVMNNRLLVNPMLVDTKSLDGEGDIYLRAGTNAAFLDRAIKQLQVQDVTSGHMGDVEMLGRLMEVVTGVNGNAMGQYNSGRRSATESRNVNAGAAGRMKMHGSLIWETSLNKLGQMMLSNSRQSLSTTSFTKITGATDPERHKQFAGTPEEVICGDDYFSFDATLSSERGFMAQSLQDLLSTLFSANPAAAMQVTQQIDPVRLLDEVQYLRGAGSISRFKLTPEQQQMQQSQQAAMMQAQTMAQQPAQPPPI